MLIWLLVYVGVIGVLWLLLDRWLSPQMWDEAIKAVESPSWEKRRVLRKMRQDALSLGQQDESSPASSKTVASPAKRY